MIVIRFNYWLIRDNNGKNISTDTIDEFRSKCHNYYGKANSVRWYDDLYHGEVGFKDKKDADHFKSMIAVLEEQDLVWRILNHK